MLLLAFAFIYYLAPNVKQSFKFITAGSVVGVVVLLVASLAFAWYTQNFGDYDATYGSIGAVIVLMMWLYIAGLAILIGSEINALIEHHADDGKTKGERSPGRGRSRPDGAPPCRGGGAGNRWARQRPSGGGIAARSRFPAGVSPVYAAARCF